MSKRSQSSRRRRRRGSGASADRSKDFYAQRAKRQGVRARSFFKLEDLDSDYRLLKPGDNVLDLGCNPGSWMQYCRPIVGQRSVVVGIDRVAPDPPIPNTEVIVGDIFELELSAITDYAPTFDIVVSDMAPDTTGIRHVDQARSELLFERALDIALEVLSSGGNFVGKLFQGPDFKRLIDRARARFERVKVVKPKASRTASIEQYIVAIGHKAEPEIEDETNPDLTQ